MTLRISSKDFIFEKGKPILVRIDRGNAAEGDAKAILARLSSEPFSLNRNRIESLNVDRPGNFRLMIAELTIQRTYDHTVAVIPISILPHQLTLTTDDLEHGDSAIEVNPEGLFKLTLVDHEERPIPHRQLTLLANLFNMDLEANLCNVMIQSDDTGSIMFLGNPCLYGIDLDRNTGIKVLPV